MGTPHYRGTLKHRAHKSLVAVRVYLWRATLKVPVVESASPVRLGGDDLDEFSPVEVSSALQGTWH